MTDLLADGGGGSGLSGSRHGALSASQPSEALRDAQGSTGRSEPPRAPAPATEPVPEWLATAHPGDTVILRADAPALAAANAMTKFLADAYPDHRFLLVASDVHAAIVPGDLRAEIRELLAATDAQWDEVTGDGALSPDYLDRMADAVTAYLAERKEEAA